METVQVTKTLRLSEVAALPSTVSIEGHTYVVDLGPGVPQGGPRYHTVTKGRTCTCYLGKDCPAIKVVAQHLIAWALAMGNEPSTLNMLLIDGKGGVTWWGFEREAHLAHPVIGDPGEAVAALTWCLAEVDRRKQSRQHLAGPTRPLAKEKNK